MASKKSSSVAGLTRDIRRNTGEAAASVKRVETGLEHVEKEIIRLRKELHADVVARIKGLQATVDAKYAMLERRVEALERQK